MMRSTSQAASRMSSTSLAVSRTLRICRMSRSERDELTAAQRGRPTDTSSARLLPAGGRAVSDRQRRVRAAAGARSGRQGDIRASDPEQLGQDWIVQQLAACSGAATSDPDAPLRP
jgi:hypothetical protein